MHFRFFFFFQAEDGIRDLYVTGVQTCALPIFRNQTSANHNQRRAQMAKAMQRVNGLGLIASEPELKIPFYAFSFTKTLSASAATPPQLRLPDQSLILVREQIALNLCHRIHGYADHD